MRPMKVRPMKSRLKKARPMRSRQAKIRPLKHEIPPASSLPSPPGPVRDEAGRKIPADALTDAR